MWLIISIRNLSTAVFGGEIAVEEWLLRFDSNTPSHFDIPVKFNAGCSYEVQLTQTTYSVGGDLKTSIHFLTFKAGTVI